jgi:Uma2 family endonuclease
MSAVEKWEFVTVEEYLAEEELSPFKREYRDGVVYAMAGARNRHNRIASNALGQLYSQLRGRPCQPYNSDTKIRIRQLSDTRFYYPDVSVVCHPNSADDSYQDAPVIILEVASPSTRRIDLGEKKDGYLTIPTLGVYLVAESNEAVVQIFRRTPDGEFQRELALGLDAVIELPEVGVSLVLADLYEGVEFTGESGSLRVREDDDME